MNYLILNGTRSTSIKGLLVQSLPPISKPMIRTQIEEIDGRDGDIVTSLGYSAYDKEVSIGLYGDFDIDAIIKYFDSAGVVTFSNEPDKYYNYQIVQQIDFERLIRFRTATVVFHVQPFKYSTAENPLNFDIDQLLSYPDFSQTKNGVTVSATSGVISISGTGTAGTEIYMPVDTLNLPAGNYTLKADADGDGASEISIRLINNSPLDANSFGGEYVTLQDGSTVTISATITAKSTYNYLYFYIDPDVALDVDLAVSVEDDNQSIIVTNAGNTTSKPLMTIYGSDTVYVYLNGNQIFVVDLGDDEYITINSATMEAYQGSVLKNRFVVGDYDYFVLNIGKNTISFTGSVTQIEIDNYSRWI